MFPSDNILSNAGLGTSKRRPTLIARHRALLGFDYPEFGDLTWFQQQAQCPSDFSHISFECGRLRA